MSNLEVKHTPAVAAVDAKPERWECDGVVVERLTVDGEIGIVYDNNSDECRALEPGEVASLHAILSAILTAKDATTARPEFRVGQRVRIVGYAGENSNSLNGKVGVLEANDEMKETYPFRVVGEHGRPLVMLHEIEPVDDAVRS